MEQPAEIDKSVLAVVKSELLSSKDCPGTALVQLVVAVHRPALERRKLAVERQNSAVERQSSAVELHNSAAEQNSSVAEQQRKPAEEQHMSGTKLRDKRKSLSILRMERDTNK